MGPNSEQTEKALAEVVVADRLYTPEEVAAQKQVIADLETQIEVAREVCRRMYQANQRIMKAAQKKAAQKMSEAKFKMLALLEPADRRLYMTRYSSTDRPSIMEPAKREFGGWVTLYTESRGLRWITWSLLVTAGWIVRDESSERITKNKFFVITDAGREALAAERTKRAAKAAK